MPGVGILSIVDAWPGILGVLGLLGIVPLLGWVFSSPDPKRAFSDLPLTPMAQSEHYRLVKVQGRVRAAGPLLQSPLTGAQCIGYRIEIEERGGRGKPDEVFSEEAVSDFLIDDGTACASVLDEGARLLLDKHPIDDDSRHRQAIDGLLARAGIDRDGHLTTIGGLKIYFEPRRFHCRESLLVDGQIVVVRATARWVDRAGDFREPPIRTLELIGSAEFPVLVGETRDVNGPASFGWAARSAS
jgi:hypothetical protein